MMKALDLARYIIYRCAEENKPISNLQLQKILYFIQVAFLQKKDRPAFEENVEAWQFGPVVPGVYYNFSGYGGMKIPVSEGEYTDVACEDEIDEICKDSISKKPWELVEISHEKGKPWDRIYKNGEGLRDIIDQDTIKKYG